MKRKFLIIDAFTSTVGKGNPAAVVLLNNDEEPQNEQLQRIAIEFNLSETVFLYPSKDDDPSKFGIRWFTPLKEVQLCGHATLAASHALKTVYPSLSNIVFESHIAGKLPVVIKGSHYELHFPCRDPAPLDGCVADDFPSRLASCFGLTPEDVVDVAFHKPSQKYLLVLASDKAVIDARADLAKLKGVSFPSPPLSVTVTAASSSDARFDVVSRHFAPWVGIDEDPVTGAAHVVLVPYWLRTPPFQAASELRCYQAFPGRGGELLCKLIDADTVSLRGEAATFAEGMLSL